MEKRLNNMKIEYENITVPSEALDRIKQGINTAKSEEKIVSFSRYKKIAVGVAAAFAICIISVNSSSTVANAMGSIPVLGRFFEVVTIRDFSKQVGDTSVSVKVPQIQDENSDAVSIVNKESAEYIDELLAQFEEDCRNLNLGFESLNINYNIITNTNSYFSLDIAAEDTVASGFEFHSFYTIDKTTDKVLTLSTLFADGVDYITPISDEIVRQMRMDTKTDYFIAENENDPEGFSRIYPEQSFYMDKEDNLVICFNEYEVAPGSAGTPRFTIPKEILDSIK